MPSAAQGRASSDLCAAVPAPKSRSARCPSRSCPVAQILVQTTCSVTCSRWRYYWGGVSHLAARPASAYISHLSHFLKDEQEKLIVPCPAGKKDWVSSHEQRSRQGTAAISPCTDLGRIEESRVDDAFKPVGGRPHAGLSAEGPPIGDIVRAVNGVFFWTSSSATNG